MQLNNWLFLLFFLLAHQASAVDIVYRGLGETSDYHTELLQLIFTHAPPNSYKATPLPKPLPQARAFKTLAANGDIDVVVGYATTERIEKFSAIPIPISKGLYSWRAPIVHQDNSDLLKNVKVSSDLKKYKAGFFHAWTDHTIFEANGIKTLKGASYEGLFHMLALKRYDFMPLPIVNAFTQMANYKTEENLNLVLDTHILIHYPVCFYFYVNKNNTELAKNITIGFENIIANGKFDTLFNKHHGLYIDHLLTQKRQIIRLHNPLLPEGVPLDRTELWL